LKTAIDGCGAPYYGSCAGDKSRRAARGGGLPRKDRMRISHACVTMATLFVVLSSSAVHAQGAPTAEGAFGYAFLHDNTTAVDAPIGWMASVAGNVTRWFALVGEVGGNYKTFESGAADLGLTLHTFTTGPRFTVPASSPVAPFAQLLVGIAHASADLSASNVSIVVRGTSFVSQLGLGVDFNPSPRRALRIELDVRELRDEGMTADQWRFAAAFVFRN
jgi:hypothetical protein